MNNERSMATVAHEDEISLIDLFRVLHKRKNIIVLFTLTFTSLALVLSFLLPKSYEVTTIFSPASRPVIDERGQVIEERFIRSPLAIKESILGGAYNQQLLSALSLNGKGLPKVIVDIPKGTNFVEIKIKTTEPKLAVAVEGELLTLLAKTQSEKLQTERLQIENLLKLHYINLKSQKDRLSLLNKQHKESKVRIDDLELARHSKISKAGDAVAVLLYSNEIKTDQLYINDLEEKIQALESVIAKQKVVEEQLLLKKELLKELEVVKLPTVPENPVGPRKSLVAVLGFVLGLIGGIVSAFLVDFLQRCKASEGLVEQAH